MQHQWLVALRFAVWEHARNRLAIGLLVVFVPLWFFVIGAMIPSTPVAFKLMSTGTLLQVNGHQVTLIASGFNALTLIIGFMLFAVTLRDAAFDRRLVLSGFGQAPLVLAKLMALVVVAAAIAAYSTLVLALFWRPSTLPFVWLGFFSDALIYGALGMFLGFLVTNELAGFFVVIMVSLLDTFLQVPVENPLANKAYLIAFPTYGPMQIAVSGGFAHTLPVLSLLLALSWFVGFAVLGLGIFWFRTRPQGHRTTERLPHQSESAKALPMHSL